MSSDTSPYKSRLFNFVNRQSLRWKDKRDRALRNFKVAAQWGTQALLYPLYLLVQGGRKVGRTLSQGVNTQRLRLQGKTVETTVTRTTDTPIQNILGTIDTALVGTEVSTFLQLSGQTISPKSLEAGKLAQKENSAADLVQDSPKELEIANKGGKRVVIQSVASNLGTKTLVLVTRENQVLNILTPLQQKELQSQITWEIANYNRQQHLSHTSQHIPLQSRTNPNLIAPVRWFWGAMVWVQSSQIAIAINIFDEANLVTTHPLLSPQVDAVGTLARIDNVIAQIEAQPTLPVDKAVEIFQSQREKFLSRSSGKEELEKRENDPYRIQVLIQAAVEYFFNRKPTTITSSPNFNLPISPSLPENKPSQKLFARFKKVLSLPQTPFRQPPREDPWLSWEDLYGESELEAAPPYQNYPDSLTAGAPIPPLTQQTSLENLKGKLRRNSQPKALKQKRSSSRGLTKAEKKAQKLVRKAEANANTSFRKTNLVPNSHNSQQGMEYDPDWLETKATPTGYVKHPLERVLGWLDRLLAWVEDKIVSIARSFFK